MSLFKKEKKVRCHLEQNGYDIVIGSGILQNIGKIIAKHVRSDTVMVVSSQKIGAVYLPLISGSLKRQGIKIVRHFVPDGERAKSEKELFSLLQALVVNRFERRSMVIALGGGVIGDLAGFAASIFMRGVDFVNVPTTLLAQVDSAIGGKTGINLAEGKNLVGTFYQPKAVISDIAALSTLPENELVNGIAEVIKYGMLFDHLFFEYIERNIDAIFDLDLEVIEKIVTKCSQYKARVVERDEKEAGLRVVLNLGHTFGHAFETLGSYKKISHGMAVALGMQAAGRLAHKLEMFDDESLDRLIRLCEKARLPISLKPFKFDESQILDVMATDKKVADKRIRLIVPVEIGSVVIRDDVKPAVIKEALRF
jgi:3-dehydroquinate synthase